MNTKYELTVGLEVHVELKTASKIFCPCPTEFGAAPNTHICPVCMGLPGALPHLNKKAVKYAIRAGLATNCKISNVSRMARKNYFYPDLPKAFQISQAEPPLCYDGYLNVNGHRVGITRIHIEEDAGKLIHGKNGATLIDYNRCGVPLIEIVSAPDIRSADEAKEYLKKLRSILLYTKISDCKMNEGSLRCDVNISIKEKGSSEAGVRVEVKNINSFAFVGKAIEAEFLRMSEILSSGGKVERETRRFDESSGKTQSMRSKEEIADYRFLDEPDIMPIKITDGQIKEIADGLPALPDERKQKYENGFGLSPYDAELLSSDIALAELFEEACGFTEHKKAVANLILGEVLRLNDSEDFFCPIGAENLAQLAELSATEQINASTAKKLVPRLWAENVSPLEIVKKEDLFAINDREELLALAKQAVEQNARAVNDYKNGKSAALRSLIGFVMSRTGGRANAKIAEEILIELLN